MPAPTIYISYAPKDAPFCEELVRHLQLLKHEGLAHTWERGMISPGVDVAAEIDRRRTSAQFIVLLVSADFLASFYETDLAAALSRSRQGKACVLPVLVRPCDWESTAVTRLTTYPSGPDGVTRAVVSWPHRDEAWAQVAKAIRQAVTTPDKGRTHAPMTSLPSSSYGAPAVTVTETPVPTAHRWSSPRPPIAGRSRAASAPRSHGGFGAPRPTPSSTPAPTSSASWPTAGRAAVTGSWAGPEPQSRRRGLGCAAIGAIMLVIAAGAALVVGLDRLMGVMHTRATAVSPRPAQGAKVTPIATNVEAPITTAPCCGGSMCAVDEQNASHRLMARRCRAGNARCDACASGRSIVPTACDTILAADWPYQLRFARIEPDPGRTLNICVRRRNDGDNWKCTGIRDSTDVIGAPATAGRATRLPLTAGDLLIGRGIDIAVMDGQSPWAVRYGASHQEVGASALCVGLGFDVQSPSTGQTAGKVYFYLDEK